MKVWVGLLEVSDYSYNGYEEVCQYSMKPVRVFEREELAKLWAERADANGETVDIEEFWVEQ